VDGVTTVSWRVEMRTARTAAGVASAATAIALGVGSVVAAPTTIPARWKNCTNVHKRYPHGVGKLHAHDRTSGTPVTTFRRSTRLYNLAMSYNKRLDADKDGIACEKR
jgi:excalibur calcium-binding domain-containing protein